MTAQRDGSAEAQNSGAGVTVIRGRVFSKVLPGPHRSGVVHGQHVMLATGPALLWRPIE